MNDLSCHLDTDGCLTCGDVAVPLVAVESGDTDVHCADDDGHRELVALELVGPARSGDHFLVHAGTAIARLSATDGRHP